MINIPTVFVLGAGSSAPYGFPTGQQLLNNVCRDSLSTEVTAELYAHCGFKGQEIAYFRQALMQSGLTSVDAFLEHRTEFLEIGKAAIAIELIRLEDTARLFNDYQGAWLKYLYGKMNTTFDNFGKNNVSFLTFNYDRLLEEFLFTSLRNTYGKSVEDTAAQLNKIPVIHLHGAIGSLPWQGGPVRSFETNVNTKTLDIARAGIKIIHEDITDGRDKDFARGTDLIQKAQRIVFLGFGYNRLNMKRLGIERSNVFALGTGTGLTSAEVQDSVIASANKINIHQATDCLDLLRSLSWA